MSTTPNPESAAVRRLTVTDIGRMYADGERIPMLTAYDYPTAKILDEAGIPLLLVGDSLGRAMLGYENELSVTMDDMIHHSAAVTRGARRAVVVGDMPFLSYATPDDALRNAGRFVHDASVQAVKVEGGVRSARVIETLRTHVFNDALWPDFMAIPNRDAPVLKLRELPEDERRLFRIGELRIVQIGPCGRPEAVAANRGFAARHTPERVS
jgi:hypothetical protein